MGKLTLYICDICEEKSEDEKYLETCWICGKEICPSCRSAIRHAIEDEDQEFYSVFKVICQQCATDKTKLLNAFKEIMN